MSVGNCTGCVIRQCDLDRLERELKEVRARAERAEARARALEETRLGPDHDDGVREG